MTTEVLVLALLLIAACSRSELLSPTSGAPLEIRAGCELASYRCTQCHSLDPVVAVTPQSPAGWSSYVDRMRHMPGSQIAAEEETPIVRCLVYRSFGLAAAQAVMP